MLPVLVPRGRREHLVETVASCASITKLSTENVHFLSAVILIVGKVATKNSNILKQKLIC